MSYKELRIIETDIDENKLVEVINLKSLRVAEFDLKYLEKNVSVLLALSRGYNWKTLKFMGSPFKTDFVRLILASNPGIFLHKLY